MSDIKQPLSPELMVVFRKSVQTHFEPIAAAVDSPLEQLSPSLYRFLAPHAEVTVGVYHGHFAGIGINLRERKLGENLIPDSRASIGLGSVIAFLNPCAPVSFRRERTKASLDVEIGKLAFDLMTYDGNFFSDPAADWKGVHDWIDVRIKENSKAREQKVITGKQGDYVGIYGVRGNESWITLELIHRTDKFGKIEKWSPVFECDLPLKLQTEINLTAGEEAYFQISFTGIPSEKGRFGLEGCCVREVRVWAVRERH